eukprot:gnl/Ergobibamus_cyprinoides/365.p3 GENE.gnl/Ergobibamus_cyprinoides/365~~gnl/Ergobibamus_cyprinoides/365.p3  ORF type:complete len:130 (+),score=40.75 gnl/Ergobibamus_cyprinoides/365:457-846(+)
MFALGIDLSAFGPDAVPYYFVLSAAFTLLYFALLLVPFTRWARTVPNKPAYRKYVLIMLCLNAMQTTGTALFACGVDAGMCLLKLAQAVYYALYAPIVFALFLVQFLKAGAIDSAFGLSIEDTYWHTSL